MSLIEDAIQRVIDADAEQAAARAALADLLGPGGRRYLDTPDGRVVAYVTDPKPGWQVADRDAFTAWVASHHPEAIVTSPTVVPLWQRQVLARGADVNGEVPDGIEPGVRPPALTIRTNPKESPNG